MAEFWRQSLADMEAERAWTEAERQVIARARTGSVVLCNGRRPVAPSGAVEVRAGLIRHLLLGGCKDAPVPDKGVSIIGAWVCEVLDLEGCVSKQSLRLGNCHLDKEPVLIDARLGAVYLPGCQVPGINAHRLRVTRSVLLNQDFKATGSVNLSSAEIGDALACDGGRFDGAVGAAALNAEALKVEADVFLRHGFHATREVVLVRATIRGNLRCNGGRFASALNGEGMQVGAGMFWEQVSELSGPLDLTDAEVGRLHDDAVSWSGANPLKLTGFRYARLSGDLTVADRLAWLGRKDERDLIAPDTEVEAPRLVNAVADWFQKSEAVQCDAQPYTHLAKVLREQGRTQAAARVLNARDRRVKEAQFQASLRGLRGGALGVYHLAAALVANVWGWLFGWLFGFGHLPGKALMKVCILVAFTWVFYAQVWRMDQFAPNSDVVLTSAEWLRAVEAGCPTTTADDYWAWQGKCRMPLDSWKGGNAAKDYETFSPFLYALDLFVPLDALGQENAWAPSKDRGSWGWWGYWMRMPVQMAGWIITAVGAAALAGLVGRKD